jgi:hypothetical protein
VQRSGRRQVGQLADRRDNSLKQRPGDLRLLISGKISDNREAPAQIFILNHASK